MPIAAVPVPRAGLSGMATEMSKAEILESPDYNNGDSREGSLLRHNFSMRVDNCRIGLIRGVSEGRNLRYSGSGSCTR